LSEDEQIRLRNMFRDSLTFDWIWNTEYEC
jgi:hypothetical protein